MAVGLADHRMRVHHSFLLAGGRAMTPEQLLAALSRISKYHSPAVFTTEERAACREAISTIKRLGFAKDNPPEWHGVPRNVDLDEIPEIKDLLLPFCNKDFFDRKALGAIKLAFYRGKQGAMKL